VIRIRTAEGRSRAQKRGQRMGRPDLPRRKRRSPAGRRAEGATLAELPRSYDVSLSTTSRLLSMSSQLLNLLRRAPALVKQKLTGLVAIMTTRFRALQQVPFTTVNPIISITATALSITSALLVPFWWSIFIISLIVGFVIIAIWRRVPVTSRLPATISRSAWSFSIVLLLTILLWVPMRNKYSREYPPLSIAYVVPGFWSPSPLPRFFMMIQHCGPEPVYNVDIIFVDQDRVKQISTHTTVTPAEIADEQVTLHFDEIDPTQGGWAKLFPWTPLNADEEHYTARIVSRHAAFNETLQIARVSQKWHYKVKVSDVTRSRPIIDCQDAGFPEPLVNPRPVCFPQYVNEHQEVCD
jgi:hypothetical protein